MKTNKNRIISPTCLRICLYVMLVFFASCKSCRKEVNALPDATQTGANTFGCVINGQAWVPNGVGGFSGIGPINGGYIDASQTVPKNSVFLRFYQNNRTSTEFYVKSVTKAGRYPLSFDTGIDLVSPNTKNFGLYTIDGPTTTDPDYNYITTSQIVGYVNFTVADTITKQLSGTFEFEATDFPSGGRVKITEGRFDVNQLKRP